MALSAAFFLVAQKLQEAATLMSHEDINARLSDALKDAYRDTGNWCYVVAVFGDDKSGDVVFTCNGDLKRTSYTCSATGATIATNAAVDVIPFTTYEPEGTQVSEAGARHNKRDMAQLQAIHDHAIGLGAACSTKESAVPNTGGALKLVESITWVDGAALTLLESAGTVEKEVKIIAPGEGSSAIYTPEALKASGPSTFKTGTPMFINHATRAEEAERPEGDWHKLVGALSSDAYYVESHKDGPGLYGKAKFAEGIAPEILAKAKLGAGLSIRASGVAVMEAGKPQTRNGKPILAKFTGCESIDIVTRAGAGGMILTEAAKPAIQQEVSEMDAAEVTKIVEAAVLKATAPLLTETAQLKERAAKGDAFLEATKLLEKVSLPPSAKQRVIEQAVQSLPMKDGVLDLAKFAESVNLFAKREGEYLGSLMPSRVQGMGSAPADPKEVDRIKESAATLERDAIEAFSAFGLSEAATKIAANSFKEAA